ncbi:glycosyl transferase family 17 protein [Amylocarpus encephaloides]|uniref:Glycosyl transferase family 17 protein n=1 Tax=Amylocarpus encephaloides TaxID=45428 RepID=A0A9P7YQU8_9HELO|nr:glycosyl transferase family 17 protein [Amylocarpus encephaloides]
MEGPLTLLLAPLISYEPKVALKRTASHDEAKIAAPRYPSSKMHVPGYRRCWEWLYRTTRQRWRSISICIVFVWLFLAYKGHTKGGHSHSITGRSYELEKSYRLPSEDSMSSASHSRNYLDIEQAQEFCVEHGFQHWPSRGTQRKVYDLFMLNDELDWLEIRLNTLAAYVDYFVILESPVTFTGLPKPLVLKEHWAQFEKFHSQIIYHEVADIPLDARWTWDMEDHQRNAMYKQVIPGLQGAQMANIGDVLIVADVEEIPRPTAITIMRNCDFPKRLTLRSQFFYYGFQWRHVGEDWAHPQATIYYGPERTILPVDLRNGEGGNRISAWWDKAELWNAGWHCSTCFEKINDVLKKMSSFSHTGYNKEEFRDRTRIVDRVRKGLDLWDRPGENYIYISDNQDIPQFLRENRLRFKYMLDRDNWSAGFVDYNEGESAPD